MIAMNTKELAAIYGKNKKGDALLNAAIRDRIPFGGQVLDAIDRINKLCRTDRSPAAGAALDELLAIRDAMRDEIRRLPPPSLATRID